MKLREVALLVQDLPDDLIICAIKPWNEDAMCILTGPTADLGVPDGVRKTQYEYFLEISIAKEVIVGANGQEIPVDRRLDLLIHYATYDG